MDRDSLLSLARQCYSRSYERLIAFDRESGLRRGDCTAHAELGKGEYSSDTVAGQAIDDYLGGLDTTVDVYFEKRRVLQEGAKRSLFIDEVDGSSNLNRKVGSPCLLFASSANTGEDIRFDDIDFVFVKSYFTGDEYWAFKGEGAWYKDGRTGAVEQLHAAGPEKVQDAIGYVKFGYGPELARKQLVRALPIILQLKDQRAFDNTAIEICEVARGAADCIVELRGCERMNMLPYLLLKEAGGVMTDDQDNDIGSRRVLDSERFDFIASANEPLRSDIRECISRYNRTNFRIQFQEIIGDIKGFFG